MLSKVKPCVVTDTAFVSLIRFTPLNDSPVDALYQTIHSIFSPLLSKGGKWGGDKRLANLLDDLERNLEKSMLGQGSIDC